VKPRLIEIDGKLYRWANILELRRTQLAAWRTAEQPALFELRIDCRPEAERTSAGRFLEPGLFDT
jgi:hypothetical protein